MRQRSDSLFAGFAWGATFLVLASIGALLAFLFVRGAGTLGPRLLFGDTAAWAALLRHAPVFDGLWPAVVGTLLLVCGSSLLAVPVGIAAGIHISEYAGPRVRRVAGLCIDLLAGIPSIIMGLFGFGLILFLRQTLLPDANTCLLLSIVCIALLILPYMIRTTETALRSLPEDALLLGPSLGFSRWRAVRHIHLPLASRGILSGMILSVGRAAEDTAVILMTGVVANAGTPQSLTDKFEGLPFTIYYLAAEHRTVGELDRAFGAALILLLVTGTIFGFAYWAHRGLEQRWSLRS
ncbi:MAG: ABC transporter permease subunit [Candidatus Eisenbacteria sp.]|nr:ABC transporter permease subunit [Candidatus Eisenbacteria bacterium]